MSESVRGAFRTRRLALAAALALVPLAERGARHWVACHFPGELSARGA